MYSVVFQIREQRRKIKISIKERLCKGLYEIGRKDVKIFSQRCFLLFKVNKA